ncbi:endoglucanase Y [Striga asiatica]|uniref:Endoglucanase Y n=1 Tax=Striga asiatica TaxID=4170 RepID=A0A5A7RGC1_STRAF|nr:endoglucanase Y [Striga asiatica]
MKKKLGLDATSGHPSDWKERTGPLAADGEQSRATSLPTSRIRVETRSSVRQHLADSGRVQRLRIGLTVTDIRAISEPNLADSEIREPRASAEALFRPEPPFWFLFLDPRTISQ